MERGAAIHLWLKESKAIGQILYGCKQENLIKVPGVTTFRTAVSVFQEVSLRDPVQRVVLKTSQRGESALMSHWCETEEEAGINRSICWRAAEGDSGVVTSRWVMSRQRGTDAQLGREDWKASMRGSEVITGKAWQVLWRVLFIYLFI